MLRLEAIFWPCWLGYLTVLVAAWLERCWVCIIAPQGYAIFDAAGVWFASNSAKPSVQGLLSAYKDLQYF